MDNKRIEINLIDYFNVLLRHRAIILIVFLGTLLITAIYALRQPNVYEAKTTFYYPISEKGDFSSVAQSIMGKESSGFVSALISSGGSPLQNYTKGILASRRIAEIIISNMNLADRLHFRSQPALVRFVQQTAQISLTMEGIMEVTVRSNDPQLSADLANGYVDAFRDFTLTSMISISKKHRMDVEERMAQLREKLHQAEMDMTKFQLKHKTPDFNLEEKNMMGVLEGLHAQQLSNEIAMKAARDTYREIQRLSIDHLHAASADLLTTPSLADPVIDGLREQLADVYLKYAQAKVSQTVANPELQSYKQQLNDIESALRQQIKRQVLSQQKGTTDDLLNFQIKIGQLQARGLALGEGIKKMEKKFDSYPTLGVEFLQKARRLKIFETLYNFLSAEYEKAKLEEARESPDFQVLDKAIRPDSKTGPHRFLNLLMGLILGLFLGIGSAFFVESIRSDVKPLSIDGHTQQPGIDYSLKQ